MVIALVGNKRPSIKVVPSLSLEPYQMKDWISTNVNNGKLSKSQALDLYYDWWRFKWVN